MSSLRHISLSQIFDKQKKNWVLVGLCLLTTTTTPTFGLWQVGEQTGFFDCGDNVAFAKNMDWNRTKQVLNFENDSFSQYILTFGLQRSGVNGKCLSQNKFRKQLQPPLEFNSSSSILLLVFLSSNICMQLCRNTGFETERLDMQEKLKNSDVNVTNKSLKRQTIQLSPNKYNTDVDDSAMILP